MRFSLIVATIERTDPLTKLLDSLCQQTFSDFQVIIADQNADDRLQAITAPYRTRLALTVQHSRRGLSAARNDALSLAYGEIVAFPDDDCWYFPDTLARIDRFLSANGRLDGVTVACCDAQMRPSVRRWAPRACPINSRNVWQLAVSIGLFIRRDRVTGVAGFDESLGAGAPTPWGSGEETAMLLRALAAGAELTYLPDRLVGHAHPHAVYDDAAAARALCYGRGMGRVLAMHNRPMAEKLRALLRPAVGGALGLLSGRPAMGRYYMNSLKGRWEGMRGKNTAPKSKFG